MLAALAGTFLGNGRRALETATLAMMLAVPLGVVLGVWLVIGLKRDAEVPVGLKKSFGASMTLLLCMIIFAISATVTHYLPDRL